MGRIGPICGYQVKALANSREHAERQTVNLENAKSVEIVFVPLDDGAAGHGGAFEGDDVIELALADDHAAGVLAEVAREVLEADAELEVFGDARVLQVKASILKRVRHGVRGTTPFKVVH